jgi:hypothetical protein
MTSNLDRYANDLDALIAKADDLQLSIEAECYPAEFEAAYGERFGPDLKKAISQLPRFRSEYQSWYSEAKATIRQLLPDRLADFVRHYEKPKPRKELNSESYRIEDYLQGVNVTRGNVAVVGPGAAVPHVMQQVAILKAVKSRFQSSLFDIRQLVQADLFDSELDAARALVKKGFNRAGGAIAGVVLEKHLAQVVANHAVKMSKKTPTIADLNDALKAAEVIDIAQWRFIQHLGDIRNICDHHKGSDPTREQVDDLVNGVAKITKTLF